MPTQAYGVSGRRPRRKNFVDIINARLDAGTLARKKDIADTAAHRDQILSLERESLAETSRFNREQLQQSKDAATRSALIGLGQAGLAAQKTGRENSAIRKIIEGTGGGEGPGAKGAIGAAKIGGATDTGSGVRSMLTKDGITNISNWKTGASNWGDILSGTLAGGTAGAQVGEKIGIGRVAGGALASGALSYLSSGDPYTAAISFGLGGALGSIM